MSWIDLIVYAGVLAIVVSTWVLVEKARAGTVPFRVLEWVATACLALLAVVTLSDWPGEWLSSFWAEHSIVGALVSTLLLVGGGLLGLEARGLHEQAKLSEAMAGTAFAGLVSPLIDVDLALALLGGSRAGLPSGWDAPQKPLRWIREMRDRGDHHAIWSAPPAARIPELDEAQAVAVLDQCIRRVVGSARDWAALAGASVDGRAVLAEYGAIRNDLTSLQALVRSADAEAPRRWIALRARVQRTAVALELASGSPRPRPDIEWLPTSDIREREATLILELRQRIGVAGNRLGSVRPLLRNDG